MPHKPIPSDYEVQPLQPEQTAGAPTTCGRCGLTWDDSVSTGRTPVPAGRCPFEEFHTYKVNAISLNQTRYFKIRDEDKPFIKEIRSVYAYDPESCTHLCELTPSYDLRYLHTYIVWSDALLEEESEKTEDLRSELDTHYCYESSEDTYMHCADVRQFAKDNPTLHKECGEFDSIEDACEHLNGNWPF